MFRFDFQILPVCVCSSGISSFPFRSRGLFAQVYNQGWRRLLHSWLLLPIPFYRLPQAASFLQQAASFVLRAHFHTSFFCFSPWPRVRKFAAPCDPFPPLHAAVLPSLIHRGGFRSVFAARLLLPLLIHRGGYRSVPAARLLIGADQLQVAPVCRQTNSLGFHCS